MASSGTSAGQGSLEEPRCQVAVVAETGTMQGIEERSGSAEKHSVWNQPCWNAPLTLLCGQHPTVQLWCCRVLLPESAVQAFGEFEFAATSGLKQTFPCRQVFELHPVFGRIEFIIGFCVMSSCLWSMTVEPRPNVMLGMHVMVQRAVEASYLDIGALATP